MQESAASRPVAGGRRLWKAAAWGYFVVVTALLVLPLPQMPLVIPFDVADKLIHAGVFGGLVVLMALAYVDAQHVEARRVLWRIAWMATFHSTAAELAQLASPGRVFELLDIVAGWVGVAAATLSCLGVLAWRTSRVRAVEPEAGGTG